MLFILTPIRRTMNRVCSSCQAAVEYESVNLTHFQEDQTLAFCKVDAALKIVPSAL